MTLAAVEIIGYRSVRKIRFPLRQLTVLVGGNGVGKTNLYRSLELLQAAAKGTLAQEIAREGGLVSIFWAGGKNLSADGSFDPMYRTDGYRKDEGNSLRLAASFADLGDGSFDPTYRLEVSFAPKKATAAFDHEAQIKSESLEWRQRGKTTNLMDRKGGAAWARDASGRRELATDDLLASETALAALSGRSEIAMVRDSLIAWRFFHGFRTDAESPLRRPSLAVTSPTLASDGSNLGAVLATLHHIRGDRIDLDRAMEDAFPGAELIIPEPGEFATFGMRFPEMPKRVFGPHELSDGTLQFIALAGALLSYRLPPFIALNEPENSLHPALMPMLARMIVKAAERSQIWVVTHSRELADAIAAESGVLPREVIRGDHGTWLEGLNQLGEFADD
ncbi:MAG: AAA family ATPase [Candidatus Devosia phytovorans]|uniref:AAA family ATPase n=1 Tax=Candidatus Devosia phytovorans TaxID=3121372 RepID=A0AAJ5VXA4_9HYPH|nr:AAA family ATPase [Devosia sp.]WEK05178.1 MAG: AAA family ATPase [Devosia sp.]